MKIAVQATKKTAVEATNRKPIFIQTTTKLFIRVMTELSAPLAEKLARMGITELNDIQRRVLATDKTPRA